MEITVTGISFRTAPVEVREQLALPGERAVEWLRAARDARLCDEALVLSTCNRTEFYLVAPGRPVPLCRLLDLVTRVKGRPCEAPERCFYQHRDGAAIDHLFRVAASLDSQIVGEHEILGQIKGAYRAALDARMSRTVLNKLLHRAFHVGSRIRTETKLCQGTASVPQAAVACAREELGGLDGKAVLLIGAGPTAELTAHALVHAGATRLIIANRTVARARQLARTLQRRHAAGGKRECLKAETVCPAVQAAPPPAPRPAPRPPKVEAIALSGIAAALPRVDLLLSSTGAPHPVVTRAAFAPHLRRRRRPLLLIDLAVPRDVDPALAEFPAVRLRNVDDLKQRVDENLRRRRAEVPRAEAIVREETAAFDQWFRSLEVVPTLRLLHERVDAILQAELDRHGKRLNAADREELDAFARRLCQRILHGPVTYLRDSAKVHAPGFESAAVDLVRQIFNLTPSEDRV